MLAPIITRFKLGNMTSAYSREGLSGLTSTERPVAHGSLGACRGDAFSVSMILGINAGKGFRCLFMGGLSRRY
jgi:hypothetical protein